MVHHYFSSFVTMLLFEVTLVELSYPIFALFIAQSLNFGRSMRTHHDLERTANIRSAAITTLVVLELSEPMYFIKAHDFLSQ